MIALLIAGLLASIAPQAQSPEAQVQPSPRVDPGVPVQLDDIEVVGRPLESLIRNFVEEVGAPNYRRNLARWNRGVCVSVANFKGETSQYIVDRVSTVAEDLGLRPGRTGCTPNIMVVATKNPDDLAAAMIERRPTAFQPGGTGMDRGRAELRVFRASDRPVRWWAVSVPTDSQTGAHAVRLPGECNAACDNDPSGLATLQYAPNISLTSGSRISTQIVDDLFRVIVLVDTNKIEGISALQLADYVAMVSLAQINPEGETSNYASILNLFEQPEYAASLTDWDQAYLRGLYNAQRNQKLAGANRSEVVATIKRAHRDLRREQNTVN